MPVFDPSTHDDLIDIDINLSTPATGKATFSTVAAMIADQTPGGGVWASYASPVEVAADVLAGNLDATAQKIADIAFGQNNPPLALIFIGVDVVGAQTYVQALDIVLADGADFYGLVMDERTAATQILVATDIENKADSGTYLLFATQDDDADWITTSIPAAWSAVEDYERTVMYYHDDNGADAVSDRLDVASMVDRLAWDADVQSPGWNATVTEVDDLTTPLTQSQKAFARANFANTALPLGTRTDTFIDPGQNLNGRPVDHIVSSDWLRARVAEAVADLITEVSEEGNKLTVDAQGQQQLGNVIDAVFAQGVDAGHFLAYSLTPLPVTSADISAQRVRFDGQAQLATGVRQVQINLYFSTDPIV